MVECIVNNILRHFLHQLLLLKSIEFLIFNAQTLRQVVYASILPFPFCLIHITLRLYHFESLSKFDVHIFKLGCDATILSFLFLARELEYLSIEDGVGLHCAQVLTFFSLDAALQIVDLGSELCHLCILQMHACLQLGSLLLNTGHSAQESSLVLRCHPLRILDGEIDYGSQVMLIECELSVSLYRRGLFSYCNQAWRYIVCRRRINVPELTKSFNLSVSCVFIAQSYFI